jgi:hypothetical protein
LRQVVDVGGYFLIYKKTEIVTNIEFAELYRRDIEKLITEIDLFKNEENLWKTTGSIRNSSGNLALHIIGGLSFHIGTTLANTSYIRHRDQEFITKGTSRKSLTDELRALISLIKETILSMTQERLNEPHPKFFDKENATISYVLTQLLLHLNYHSGQVNYLRRAFE